ncbi:MAG: hypothetical protein AAFZ65_12690, partial [Planctomycetota bacterium]
MSSFAQDLSTVDWQLGSALMASGAALIPLGGALLQRVQPGRRVFFARWGFSHQAAVGAEQALAEEDQHPGQGRA